MRADVDNEKWPKSVSFYALRKLSQTPTTPRHRLREAGAGGSNPLTPTINSASYLEG
jgi:hypothetical protein